VDGVALEVGELDVPVDDLRGDALLVQVRERVLGRAPARERVRDVVEAGLVARDELERDVLVVARERRAAGVARALGQAELERPAPGRLADVGDPQADVVEPPEPDHCVTRTGSRLMPLKKFDRSRAGGPASSIVADRDRSSSNAMRTSIRARCAPMQ
jgi:hypothetical protein